MLGGIFSFFGAFISYISTIAPVVMGAEEQAASLLNPVIVWIESSDPSLIVASIAVIFIALTMVSVVVYFVLNGSLISLVGAANRGEKPGLRSGLAAGLNKAIPIFGQQLLLVVPLILAFGSLIAIDAFIFVLALPEEGSISSGLLVLAIILAIILILLFIVSAITVGIINYLAARFIVIDNLKAVASVKQAFLMLRKYPGPVFLSWLIMVGVGYAAGSILGIFVLIVLVPAIVVGLLNIIAGLVTGIITFFLLLIPFGFYAAFDSAYWTNFFTALREKETGTPTLGVPDTGTVTV